MANDDTNPQRRRQGNEPFHRRGAALPVSVLQFWQWSTSDLLANTTRLGARLLAHGFTADGAEPGMAVDLHALRDSHPLPPQLIMGRVRDAHDLAAWTATLADGFGEGEREAQWVGEMYRRIGLDADRTWRHYVGGY